MPFLWLLDQECHNLNLIHQKQQYNVMISSVVPARDGALDGDGGADGLDGDEDEVAVLWVRVVSDLFLLDMLPSCRDAVQFVTVRVWIRTGEQVLYSYVLISIYINVGM